MSRFSGKCDLYDHIAGQGGWYDENGNPVKIGDPNVRCLYSDEMQDFLAFKKATGGVIHQHKVMKVDPWNYEEVTKLTNGNFQAIPHVEKIPDKRAKGGFREKTTYTYKYWNKEYKTLKELNKHKVYITIDIKFDTLLDLIPYYPYIVCMSYSDSDKQIVYISQESYVDEERDGHLENGYYSDFWQHYKKELQDHYREIVLTYFDPKGWEMEDEVDFDKNRRARVMRIDTNFPVEWSFYQGQDQTHWSSPKVIDADKGIIEMSEQDYNNIRFCGHLKRHKVKYVMQRKRPLNLG